MKTAKDSTARKDNLTDRLHGGEIPKPLHGKERVVDFSVSINPLGVSSRAKASLLKSIGRAAQYPEPTSGSLKKALARFCDVDPDNLLIGNGSIELIHLIPRGIAAKKVLILTPTFSEYEFAAGAGGAKTVFIQAEEKDDFRIDLDRVRSLIARVNMMFICNPNNPTGIRLSPNETADLARRCARHRTLLVLDEAFMDFTEGAGDPTLLQSIRKNKYLLILRSLTKFFALPGLRIGYAAGHEDLIKRLSARQYPWNVNALAQVAGEEVLKDRRYMRDSVKYVARQRAILSSQLKAIKGLKVYPASSNFIFCKLDQCEIKSAAELNQRLIRWGLYVRNCGNFRGVSEQFFRVAVRKESENRTLVLALKEVL